jgi:peptide chain release factor 1
VLDAREGLIACRIEGERAAALFADEAGLHRWQRVPPNEKHGRLHTSAVTVAVLPEPTETEVRVAPGDLSWAFSRGSGPGGQNRNKLETAVDLTHRPTGTVVHCESERSQFRNKELALALLRARLWAAARERDERTRADARRRQIGTGERAERRRSVRCQDGVVIDHVTGRRWRLADYLAGKW